MPRKRRSSVGYYRKHYRRKSSLKNPPCDIEDHCVNLDTAFVSPSELPTQSHSVEDSCSGLDTAFVCPSELPTQSHSTLFCIIFS